MVLQNIRGFLAFDCRALSPRSELWLVFEKLRIGPWFETSGSIQRGVCRPQLKVLLEFRLWSILRVTEPEFC